MFLPIFGSIDGDFWLNAVTIVIFLAIYLWYLKHNHKHDEKLLDEVKKIRELVESDSIKRK